MAFHTAEEEKNNPFIISQFTLKEAVRQTGGGFGGCVVAVVKPEDVQSVKNAINAQYKAVSGIDANIFETKACDGATFKKL